MDTRVEQATQLLRRFSWAVAVILAVLMPLGQWLHLSNASQASLQVEARQLADVYSLKASRDPDTWLYRLNELQVELNMVRQRGNVDAVRLLGPRGQELIASGDLPVGWARVETAQVLDSGVAVATLELRAGAARHLVGVLQAALLGLVVAGGVWWLLARVALGSLEQAITDLRALRDEAEGASRAKSAFLAAMSHEIRTPMNGVLGMAELLAHSPLDDEQAQTVATVRQSAQALLRIIDDILDFSKIEAGRLALELEPLALPALVDSACEALAPVAAAKGVRLWVCVERGVPEQVSGDAVRLRQVLINLVGNAIKFSARHGQSADGADLPDAGGPNGLGSVEVRVACDGEGVRFTVCDNGIGIDEATQSRLFTAFTQAEVSTARRFGGTGLGLAICRRLVELMGGQIAVRSSPGLGSTFTFWLPLAAEGLQPEPAMVDLHGLHTVLVVDNALPRDDIRAWLTAAGAQVHDVATLADAIATASRLPAPVVLVRDGALGEPPPHDNTLGDLRHLVIGQGRRGPARLASPTTATLDLLRRWALLRAVAMLAGRASPEATPGPDDRLGRAAGPLPTVDQAREQGRLILVAEDDPVNRLVILRQLALLGHAAEVANNGAIALQMWRRGGYALLLTDLHMPELDGYALATAVRADELEAGQRRQPIVALTANALKGEAARARASGIDDYLTKPAPLQLLQATLQRWLPGAVERSTVPVQAVVGADCLLDLDVLRTLVGDDDALIEDLRQDFLRQCQGDGSALQQALIDGNKQRVASIAHRLKAAARSMGATALGSLCERLELAPAGDNALAARAQAGVLAKLLDRTQQALMQAGPAHPAVAGEAETAAQQR